MKLFLLSLVACLTVQANAKVKSGKKQMSTQIYEVINSEKKTVAQIKIDDKGKVEITNQDDSKDAEEVAGLVKETNAADHINIGAAPSKDARGNVSEVIKREDQKFAKKMPDYLTDQLSYFDLFLRPVANHKK